MRIAPAILLTLLLAACSSRSGREGEESSGPREPVRLCIENATAGYGNVDARVKTLKILVPPGETVCREMQVGGGSIPVRAITTGGGATGRLTFSGRIEPMHSRCWRWKLTNAPGAGLDLRPCDDRNDEF